MKLMKRLSMLIIFMITGFTLLSGAVRAEGDSCVNEKKNLIAGSVRITDNSEFPAENLDSWKKIMLSGGASCVEVKVGAGPVSILRNYNETAEGKYSEHITIVRRNENHSVANSEITVDCACYQKVSDLRLRRVVTIFRENIKGYGVDAKTARTNAQENCQNLICSSCDMNAVTICK